MPVFYAKAPAFTIIPKLSQHNPLTGRRYLQEIIIKDRSEYDKSKDASNKNDLARYLSAISSFTATQKGPSIGLTLQVAPDYPVITDAGRPLSPYAIYPPHCHDAVEVYFSLNSQWVVDDGLLSSRRSAQIRRIKNVSRTGHLAGKHGE